MAWDGVLVGICAETVRPSRAELTERENILITGGASTGLNTVLQKVTWPGYTRRIFMIAPTYYLAAGIFKGNEPSKDGIDVDCGYSQRITGIPEDDEGVNLSILQSHLDNFEGDDETEKPVWQKWTYRYVFYGVPTFSNPTGCIMSLSRRKHLIEVSNFRSKLTQLDRKYNMLLITDDVYDLLTYTSDPIPPRLVTLDSLSTEEGFGNTISNCTFSKLLAPGLRFGFIQGRKSLIHELSTQYALSPKTKLTKVALR